MPHVLNKISNVKIEALRQQLEKDKAQHAKEGMFLEHIWKDVDHPEDVYFLFKVDDIQKHKELMNHLHKQAILKDPNVNLPHKIFLDEV